MSNIHIDLTFSAVSALAAEKYVGLFKTHVNYDQPSFRHEIVEKVVDHNNGSTSVYWIGNASFCVDVGNVNTTLIEVDSVRYGFVPGSQEVFNNLFNDTRVQIFDSAGVDINVNDELTRYLHNKVQEQSVDIDRLESELDASQQNLKNQEIRLQDLEFKYRQIQAYIHQYIDLTKMCGIVRELAVQVDESLLENYPPKSIH